MPPLNPTFCVQKDPGLAGTLSLFLPGLGQIYNGETRKGILFVGVSIVNFMLFLELLLRTRLLDCFREFGRAFHLVPNQALVDSLTQLHFTSPPVLLAIGFFIVFALYATKDAYKSVDKKRQPIYAESALTLSEATSGSYLAHCALLTNCFLFALFFLIPTHPPKEIPTIIFVTNPSPNLKKTTLLKYSEKPSAPAGPHVNKPPNPSASRTISRQTPTQPMTPHAMAPANLQKLEQPRMPTPTKSVSAPRPQLRPVLQQSLPLPSLTMNRSAVSRTSPPLVALTPPPSLSAARNAPPAPMPLRTNPLSTPGPMPMQTTGHSGNPMPQPMQRPGGSGFNSQSAPTPLSIDSGTERGRLPTGPMPTGGVRTGRSGQPSHQPQPNRVGGPLGGPLGGPAGGPSIAVNPITGPSGPPGFRGGNPTIGESGLPNSEANNLPKLPPSLASRPIDFGPYMADLQRRIRRAWIPARQPDSRQVVVVFKIHPNGEMSNLRLTQTSGSAEADQRAMQAVERAAPFRPLPDGQKDEVDIQFTFDYKVFSGSGVFRRF